MCTSDGENEGFRSSGSSGLVVGNGNINRERGGREVAKTFTIVLSSLKVFAGPPKSSERASAESINTVNAPGGADELS